MIQISDHGTNLKAPFSLILEINNFLIWLYGKKYIEFEEDISRKRAKMVNRNGRRGIWKWNVGIT